MLEDYDVTDRVVGVADSFQGPPQLGRDTHSARSYASPEEAGMAALQREVRSGVAEMIGRLEARKSLEDVREHFARYGLLDEQVRFLRGWFGDTLPTAPIARLAVLRLDGDFYESSLEALEALYPKLSPGGYAIVDDYGTFTECRAVLWVMEHTRSTAEAGWTQMTMPAARRGYSLLVVAARRARAEWMVLLTEPGRR